MMLSCQPPRHTTPFGDVLTIAAPATILPDAPNLEGRPHRNKWGILNLDAPHNCFETAFSQSGRAENGQVRKASMSAKRESEIHRFPGL